MWVPAVKNNRKGFTLLEVLAAISIFSLITLILTRIFITSTKTATVLENFSYESKQIDIFMTNISKMLGKIYLYPVFLDDIKGYEYLSSQYKISLKCPLYVEKSRAFGEGTEILRFIQYDPASFEDLLYGIAITEIKVKGDTDKKAIYFSSIPVYPDQNINKEIVTKAQNKEYLLLENIEAFKVLVMGDDHKWKEEFSCDFSKKDEEKNGKKETVIPIPQFIKILVKKKIDSDKSREFSRTIKLF